MTNHWVPKVATAAFVVAALATTMAPKTAQANACPPADIKITTGPCIGGYETITYTCDGVVFSQIKAPCT
jgi:hypothetical protein